MTIYSDIFYYFPLPQTYLTRWSKNKVHTMIPHTTWCR